MNSITFPFVLFRKQKKHSISSWKFPSNPILSKYNQNNKTSVQKLQAHNTGTKLYLLSEAFIHRPKRPTPQRGTLLPGNDSSSVFPLQGKAMNRLHNQTNCSIIIRNGSYTSKKILKSSSFSSLSHSVFT